MEWQQPNQPNMNTIGEYSYLPFYQQDPNQPQPNYNYDDEDNDAWDDDDEGYTDQNAYYYAEHNMASVDGTTWLAVERPGTPGRTNNMAADAFKNEKLPLPGFTPNISTQEQDNMIQDKETKAAMLKAKLLEKRASSRGANKTDTEDITSGFARPDIDRQESDSAIDKLVKEARAAAEAQAKRKDGFQDEPFQHRLSPIEPVPITTPADLTVQNSSKARKGNSQKNSKQANKAAKAEARIQQQQEPAQSARVADQKVVSTPKTNVPTKPAAFKHTDPSSRLETKSDNNINTPILGAEDSRSYKKDTTAINSRVEDIKKPRAALPSRSETLLSTSTVQQEASTALVPAMASPDTAHESIAAYSHHFDDLDEWLDVTGYHDRGNREKTLSLHRRKAQLEREMADIDRELEQTVSSRSRIIRTPLLPSARRTSSTLSMPPPPAPLTTAAAGVQASPNTRNGTKRLRSPERLSDSHHADKHQRTNSANKLPRASTSDRPGTSSNTLDLPSGPRRKDVSPGLNIRGAEKTTPDHKYGQSSPSRGRARSFSPTARRGSISVTEGHRSHTVRGRFAMRESSPPPKRQLATVHGSRSPIPSTWNAYRPAIHDSPHRPAAASDHQGSYRGRSFSGARSGGSQDFSQGRIESNANTSSLGLGLQRGGCRYFMIKSWNHENVETALQEGTWATQVQNEELFAEAYKNSRHVIFFFSVNNSKAFQGYARMESLPGAAITPSWVKNLRWPSSPPFYIRWLSVAETRFSRVGHLKNALNEGQPVLVGRDGQEIEETCGAALCEAIDEESKWNGGGGEAVF